MTTIKFSEFKSLILEEASKIFLKEGFKLNKGKQSFKKSIAKNVIEYSFDFINYYPDWYEYNFGFSISIDEIDRIKNEFYEYAQIQKGLAYACFYYNGDFINEVKYKDRKNRSAYYNKIYSSEDLSNSIDKTLQIIEDEALPFSYKLCDLTYFQNYFLNNKKEIVRNFESEPLFVSTLLAAYLRNVEEFRELSSYFKSHLEMEKSKGSDYKQLFVLLKKLNEFVDHKS